MNTTAPKTEPSAPTHTPISSGEFTKGNQFTETGHVLACLEQCAARKPLVTLNTFIGFDATMRPAQLRALAGKLIAIANDAEAQPMGKRTFRPSLRRY